MSLNRTAYLALLALVWIHAASAGNDTQTLNTVYEHWGFPTQLASWSASSLQTACNMTGIRCNSQSQVVSLSLNDIPTLGTFDPLLFSLTSLCSITLYEMNLIGPIPALISQLTNLQLLQLSSNFLTGTIPLSLSILVSLTALDLNSNHFIGPIPQQLSTLVLLNQLQVGTNQLSGPLPPALSCLSSLVNFYAPFNDLSGQIPEQYGTLKQLASLYLASNALSSTIPPQLSEIAALKLSVNKNLAMCGPSLMYGPQEGTNIGQDCATSPHLNAAAIFGLVVCGIGGVMLIILFIYNCVGCIYDTMAVERELQEASLRETSRAARRAMMSNVPVIATTQPKQEPQICMQKLTRPPAASRAELSSLSIPE